MKKKLHHKLIAVVLFFSIFVFSSFEAPKAHAYAVADIAHTIVNTFTGVSTTGGWLSTLAKWVSDSMSQYTIVAYKVAALMAVQQLTQLIIGGGSGQIITDYNQYLYISPQQRAWSQMTSFFNTVSAGRLSALNYEGIGPNYDAYLVAQARQSIMGQPFATNLQQQVTDPTKLFATGNMKGVMSFFECANNPYCYSLVAQNKYNTDLAKAQDIAKNEQVNGFLPTKTSSGRIKQPAALLQNALLQADQLGTQLIMNADYKDGTAALGQIAAGAGINIASRSINYYTSSDQGKEAIRNQNDQFPFSLAYNSNGGFGINAGGIRAYTGVGAGVGGCKKIGNTNSCMNLDVNAQGGQVTSTSQRTR
ncbi:MAG TPA: hypothetical protein VF817_05010 [Patescibacteria group bacterium]